jgi:uncharacterized protein
VDSLYVRRARDLVEEALTGFRVVIVNGPRQSGKSTLVRMVHERIGGDATTLDDRGSLKAARTDPAGFLSTRRHPFSIDEVQRGGDPLVLAIKADVDRHGQTPGRFLLAGSSRFLTVPNLTESLAGRARIVELWPLSQGELGGGDDRLIDRLFEPTRSIRSIETVAVSRSDVADRIVRGGFPAIHQLEQSQLRRAWFEEYLRGIIDRDLVELRRPHRTLDLGRVVRLVLARTAQEIIPTKIGSDLGVTGDTIRDYVALLETVYVHHSLPAWSSSATGRAVKRPKLHAVDTGVAAFVLNASVDLLAHPEQPLLGPLFETFVVNEIAKQKTWTDLDVRLYHYRDSSQREVDLVIETGDGRIVGVEMKAAVDVDDHDFRHLRMLRDRLGDRFINGVVVHLGDRPSAFGDRLTALPVSSLWGPT